MNINKLKGRIVEHGLTMQDMAEKLGIDRSALYRKMSEKSEFTVGEAKRVVDILELSDEDAIAIFFNV